MIGPLYIEQTPVIVIVMVVSKLKSNAKDKRRAPYYSRARQIKLSICMCTIIELLLNSLITTYKRFTVYLGCHSKSEQLVSQHVSKSRGEHVALDKSQI